MQTHAWPADGTCYGGESDSAALNAPTQPVEKLLFFPFDDHRTTSNTERRNERVMRFQFAGKPVRPLRQARYAMVMRHRAQTNRLSEPASKVLPEVADTLLEANSSDNPIR